MDQDVRSVVKGVCGMRVSGVPYFSDNGDPLTPFLRLVCRACTIVAKAISVHLLPTYEDIPYDGEEWAKRYGRLVFSLREANWENVYRSAIFGLGGGAPTDITEFIRAVLSECEKCSDYDRSCERILDEVGEKQPDLTMVVFAVLQRRHIENHKGSDATWEHISS